MLRRDVDEITEYVVVPDLQRTDAGLLGIACLQRGDHAARFVAQCAGLVESGVVTFPDEAAIALEQRQFVGERVGEFAGKRRTWSKAGGERTCDLLRPFRAAERVREVARSDQSVAHGGEGARAAA